MRHAGRCHCGRIAFHVTGDLGAVLECNCSHCSRKGYLLWFVPRDQLELATPETELATYTFNLPGTGRYRVSATWVSNPDFWSANTRFEVHALAVGTPVRLGVVHALQQ